MNNEEKRNKLNKYLISVDRLKTKCDDAARWESISMGASGSIRIRSGRSGPDEIKENAIQTRQECETLAGEVRDLRRQLDDALSTIPDERLRAILESKYIKGMTDRQLQDKYGYSERHMRRLITQAIQQLDKSSSFFP